MPKRVSLLLLTLLVASLLVSAFLLAQYYLGSLAEQRQYDALIRQKNSAATGGQPAPAGSSGGNTPGQGADSDTLSQYRALAAVNSDMVGWITIPGTIVDYPVMQTPADAQYYLNRNFIRERADSGSIFMDARCNPELPQNVILYGHNMKSGTMFGVLSEFQREGFAREHRSIYFDTLTEQRRYKVISCFTVVLSDSAKAKTIYDFVDLGQAASLAGFGSIIEAQSDSVDGWTTGDTGDYLTLSTCTGDSDARRLVVVAQRVSD